MYVEGSITVHTEKKTRRQGHLLEISSGIGGKEKKEVTVEIFRSFLLPRLRMIPSSDDDDDADDSSPLPPPHLTTTLVHDGFYLGRGSTHDAVVAVTNTLRRGTFWATVLSPSSSSSFLRGCSAFRVRVGRPPLPLHCGKIEEEEEDPVDVKDCGKRVRRCCTECNTNCCTCSTVDNWDRWGDGPITRIFHLTKWF